MSYKIRNAREEDIAKLVDFFGKVYKPGHITTDKKYLDWQYKNVPGNPFYPDYSNILLFENDKIVGHLGMIPYRCKIRGRGFASAFLASLIVDEDTRNFGAAAFFLKEAEKTFDILYTTGSNDSADSVFKFCKWFKGENLSRWVYGCQKKEIRRNNNYKNIVEIKDFDKMWNESWVELNKHYPITIDRTSEYLNWRYRDNPYVDYKIFGYKKNDNYEGYAVLRKEIGNEFTAYRIVDFVGNPEIAAPFLRGVLSATETEGVDFLDFFSNSEKHGLSFVEAGFSLYNPDVDIEPPLFILPSRRNYFVINFSYKFISPDLNGYGSKDWYVVKADGDRDRAF